MTETAHPTRSAAFWPWLAAGLGVAVPWFVYVCSVGLPNRVRGDAIAYLRVAANARSTADVLGYAGDRTLGFPAFLYAIRMPFELVSALGPETLGAFVNVVAIVLFAIHVASSVAFFSRMREMVRVSLGVPLHPAALALLVAYPGLVAYTTVPLTDTLAADLMMVGAVLCVPPATAARSWRLGRAAGAGLLLGALVLVRPSALTTTGAFLLAALAQALWKDRGRAATLALSITLWSGLVGWQVHTCARAYGEVCLLDPAATRKALAESVSWGTTSARHYWSRHSDDVEGRVTVPDPLLTRVLGQRCRARTLVGRDGILGCILAEPISYPLLVLKKSIGLFDSYQLQPYAVDVTPRWARLASRPFGALAFAGFTAVVGWLALLLRGAPTSPLVIVLSAPVVHVAWQALFHVEPRYGLAAVPFSLVMLVATAQYLPRLARAWRVAVAIALIVAGLVFLAQTSSWDAGDEALHRIESSPQ